LKKQLDIGIDIKGRRPSDVQANPIHNTTIMHQRSSIQMVKNFDSHYQISPVDLKLGNEIGKGAEGTVVIGEYSGAEVAIKIVTIEFDPHLVNDVKNEAEISVRLRHPNVVQFFGLSMFENRLMLVMEICKMSLKDYVYNHRNKVRGTLHPPLLHAPLLLTPLARFAPVCTTADQLPADVNVPQRHGGGNEVPPPQQGHPPRPEAG
jgi:hypothetical protein